MGLQQAPVATPTPQPQAQAYQPPISDFNTNNNAAYVLLEENPEANLPAVSIEETEKYRNRFILFNNVFVSLPAYVMDLVAMAFMLELIRK